MLGGEGASQRVGVGPSLSLASLRTDLLGDRLRPHLTSLGLRPGLELPLASTIARDTLFAPTDLRPSSLGNPAAGGESPRAWVDLPHISLSSDLLAGEGREASGLYVPQGPASIVPRVHADLQLVGLLGEGGMGRVHLARQRSLSREVAIKTLKDEVADAKASERLWAEATTMGMLEHPNVVPVHAVGRDDRGKLVLVMKRVDGVAWSELLHDPAHPRWSVLEPEPDRRLEAHLRILEQVATALHFAHARGVVHRDVKPENVLLGEQGEVYLADWGVAQRVGDGSLPELVGTPAYMAPEMVLGDPAFIDARTDVFLLGAALHEVLTGVPPHAGSTLQEALFAALDARPPVYSCDVPEELGDIAKRAMSTSPEDRYPSALAFRLALDERRKHLGALTLLRSARALLTALEREQDARVDGLRDRRLIECRFAFVLALREWPDSPEGRAGFEAIVRLCVEHELQRDNASAARALLAELVEVDPTLEQRVAALELELARRKEDADRLQRLAREEDLSVGLKARLGVWVALCVGVLGVALYVRGEMAGGAKVEASLAVRTAAVIAALVFVGFVALRRQLLRNAAGRKSSIMVAVGVLGVLAHRLVGAAHGASVSALLSMDLVLVAAVAASLSTLVPRAGWAALFALAVTPLTVLFPEQVPLLFASGVGLTLLATAVLWGSAVRRPPQ